MPMMSLALCQTYHCFKIPLIDTNVHCSNYSLFQIDSLDAFQMSLAFCRTSISFKSQ